MQHENKVSFLVYGDYALFSDPIMRIGGEKCTYQIPTYETIKGIMHSIYWKPTLIWVIDRVRVMKKIQTVVKGIRPVKYNGGNDLAYYTYLKDCAYQVEAHFEWNENRPELKQDRNENKHHEIARRCIRKGGRRDIFLGARECQGFVEPCVFGEGIGAYDDLSELSFGLMLHGITYPDEAYSNETKGVMTTRLWRPVMKKGIIEFIRPEQCEITRMIRPMKMRIFGNSEGNFQGAEELWGEIDGPAAKGI